MTSHDVYAATARFLSRCGHDVARVAELGLSEAEDEEIVLAARRDARILVTCAKRCGSRVFQGAFAAGVILLRILPSRQAAVHRQLQHVLSVYTAETLRHAFVVVEPEGHRFRKLPRPGTPQ